MGYADNVPQTYMGSDFFGFVVPFEDWPSEIQQYYTYDPAKGGGAARRGRAGARHRRQTVPDHAADARRLGRGDQ